MLQGMEESPYVDWRDVEGDIRTSLNYELTEFDYLTSTVKLSNEFDEPQTADCFRAQKESVE